MYIVQLKKLKHDLRRNIITRTNNLCELLRKIAEHLKSIISSGRKENCKVYFFNEYYSRNFSDQN
jgi:hypothetical protein